MIRLTIFAVLLALVTWLLHRRLVRATDLPPRWARPADAALVTLWALTLVGVGSGEVFDTGWARPLGFVGWVWLASLLYLLPGLLIVAVVSGIGRFAVRRRRNSGTDTTVADRGRRRALRIGTGVAVLGALATVGYGVVEAANPRVVRVRVPLARLPHPFGGMRIALVSDLHVGPARGSAFTQHVVDLVEAENVDLVALVGDLVDGTVAKVAPDLAPLAGLHAPLGVFGVSGNHEFYADDGGRWLDVWDRLGIRTLRNERVELRRGGAVLDIAGVHDFSSPAPYEPDLAATLAGRDPGRPVILLAHQPKQVIEASQSGVDLQLSGHTHGGQMWPLGYLVPAQQPSVTGLDRFGGTTLYTTRGAGAWGPPVRVGAPPEVTILELVRES